VWLNVGLVEEIPRVGDYLVRDLAVFNTSILVVRGKDVVIRGFHNVCSHRGNKLVWDEKGSCRGFLTCNFHSWTYNTEGRLTWVPDEENFFDLQKSEQGLTPVATDIWEGFIFIHLDPRPKESLKEYMGEVREQLQGGPFAELTLAHTYKVEEKANWKVALDAQNEVYHLPFQHRYSFPDIFVLKENRFTRLLAVKLYKRHSVYSCEVNPERRVTPVEALTYRVDSSTVGCRLPMIGDFDFYTIFPNFAVLLFKGLSNDFCLTYNFWPLAVDRTIWEIKLYFLPAENAGHRFSQEHMKCRVRNVLQEDARAHEALQSGLASRAKTHFILQDDEIQIRHFHKVLEDQVGFYRGA